MKENVNLDPKTLRLREIIKESGHRSVLQWCKAYGMNQPTVSNYMSGFRVPSGDFLIDLASKVPQYNKDWILYGTGEKYNPQYVEVSGSNNVTQVNVTGDNVNKPDNTSTIVTLSEKLSNMADRLADTFDKLTAATEKCKVLEEQLSEARKMIEKYKSQSE